MGILEKKEGEKGGTWVRLLFPIFFLLALSLRIPPLYTLLFIEKLPDSR